MKKLLFYLALFITLVIPSSIVLALEEEITEGPEIVSVEPEEIVLETPSATVSVYTYSSLKLAFNFNDSNVYAYQIYRATSKTGKYTKITTIYTDGKTVGDNLTHVDTKLTFNKVYYYKVRAYSKENSKITYSSFTSALGKRVAVGTPNPTGKSTTFLKNTVTWNKVSGASGYYVYKQINGKYVNVKNTTSLSFTDVLKDSTTDLDLQNTYKIKAYRTINGKKYYSTASAAIIVDSKLADTKLTYSSIDTRSFKINITSVSGATGYEIYQCTDSTCEDMSLISNKSTTITATDMATKYYFTARALREINDETNYTDFTEVYEFSAKPATPNLLYLYTAKEYNFMMVGNNNPTNKYKLFRSTSKEGNYVEVILDEDSGYSIDVHPGDYSEDEEGAYDYEFMDRNVSVGKTYYYKTQLVIEEEGIEYSSDLSDPICIKQIPPQVPGLLLEGYTYNSTFLGWYPYEDAYDGFEVYRATSKTGKYTKIKTTTSNQFIDTRLTIGKLYYYKVRAYYKGPDGKIYYGPFSSIFGRRVKALQALHNYPVQMSDIDNSGTSTEIIKSVSFTKKSTIGDYVIYEMKINYSKTWSSYKHNVRYHLYLYDFAGGYNTISIVHKDLPKGTKKNYSIKITVKIPKRIVYWKFA